MNDDNIRWCIVNCETYKAADLAEDELDALETKLAALRAQVARLDEALKRVELIANTTPDEPVNYAKEYRKFSEIIRVARAARQTETA